MSEKHEFLAMEYSSPLGRNYKLNESLASQREKKNESEGKSLENVSFSGSEKSYKLFSVDNTRRVKRNSNFDRSFSFGSDQKNKWNSPNQRNRQKRNAHSISIADYYHPSMVEDPWKELIQKGSTN